jgi:hypothetical protein
MAFFGWRRGKNKAQEYYYPRTVDFLKNNENIIQRWPYKVKTGLLSSEKYFAVLTDSRILCVDDEGSRYGIWNLDEIKVVPTNRSTSSSFSFSYGNHSYGSRYSSGTGGGVGSSNVIGDLEIIKEGKVEYVIKGVYDPDGIAYRIAAMQESQR